MYVCMYIHVLMFKYCEKVCMYVCNNVCNVQNVCTTYVMYARMYVYVYACGGYVCMMCICVCIHACM